MDHLTSDERKARWYCRDVQPRALHVKRAEKWTDLLAVPPNNSSCDEVHRASETPRYDFVYSLPFEWLDTSKAPRDTNHLQSLDLARQSGQETQPDDILQQVLETHGFAVVSSVLTEGDCTEALDLAWDWMEAASTAEYHCMQQQSSCDHEPNRAVQLVNRHDTSTHAASPRTAYPRTVEGGLMPFYGSGHSSLAWKVRSHPAVRRVFASLQGTTHLCDDQSHLLSSLDGFVLWTTQSMKDSEDAGWFHIDQNPRCKPGPEAVQGLVNLIPVTPTSGGNALVVQSHLDFARGHYDTPDSTVCCDDTVRTFYQQRLTEIGDDDWLEIDPNDKQLLHPSRIVSLLMNAGDVLLWDSRVVHCSYPPTLDGASLSRHGFVRAATLVSMIPATVSPVVQRARRHAVEECRTLTHWVNKVAPLGQERADDVAKERACVEFMRAHQPPGKPVLLRWEDLDDIQKKLVVGKEPVSQEERTASEFQGLYGTTSTGS